jgi:formaldehyde-activating enzyme involved in methanogenesis|tara:strand:+ start:108 stop:308 length:201 start_codon:yes stop_codon:yes gene_type:complete
MKDVIAKIVEEEIEKRLFSEDAKEKFVKKVNDNVNIPILNEKTEQKIFEAIWEAVEDVARATILKK